MKTKLFICLSILLMMCACASTPRTKWTDRVMRIMVDPDSFTSQDYVAIEKSLVESGKWVVIDRGLGFKALKLEQERLHKTEPTRYDPPEKWALWGKLYGVGGVVVGQSTCQHAIGLFHRGYQKCIHYLAIVDANTGQVMAAASAKEEGDVNEEALTVPWDEAVEALNKAYPEKFDNHTYSESIENYRKVSDEEAKRIK